MRQRRIVRAAAAAAVVAGLAGVPATRAQALETPPSYAFGPTTPFVVGSSQTATPAPEGPTVPAARGLLYVIGDSISLGVPYEQAAGAVGFASRVRAAYGWALITHRTVATWPGSSTPTLAEATASAARVVVVELGTNDLECLHYYEHWCPDTPRDDDPAHPAFEAAERARVVDELTSTVNALTGAGKCVVWLAPRRPEGRNPTLADDDVTWFAQQLDGLVAAHPGRLFDARYEAATREDPALVGDFGRPGSDGVHPGTAAGRQAIADLAVRTAVADCAPTPLPAEAPGPPQPGPGPAPPAPTSIPRPAPTAPTPTRQGLQLSARPMAHLRSASDALAVRLVLRRRATVTLRALLPDGSSAATRRVVHAPTGALRVRLRPTDRLRRALARRATTVTVRATVDGAAARSVRIRVAR